MSAMCDLWGGSKEPPYRAMFLMALAIFYLKKDRINKKGYLKSKRIESDSSK